MKNEVSLKGIINKAVELGSYFITVTTRDKSRDENDLVHYAFQKEFPIDDIVPSIDASVRSMGITPPEPKDITYAPKIGENNPPLKIAILTHFNSCPDSYSPGKAVKNQIKLLQQYGHEVVFFVQEGSKLDAGCEMRPVVPKFKRKKWVIDEEAKEKFKAVIKENLTTDFDVAITHDFYIDDCITYREAIRECGVDIPWLHWARSGVGRSIDFSMDNARYVYMNIADAGTFASKISVDMDKVRVVFNEKDPALLFGWNPVTKMISDKMRLWEKDIIQTYPMCTTRMDAKGINSVIMTFASLKKAGKKVALIICNSNGRRRLDEIKAKIEFAKECGLTEEDFVFTNTLASDEHKIISEVPNQVVAQLMQISNLFIFPTIAEVCSNVLLEASMTKNLLVLNEDLPSLFDFAADGQVLSHKFTSLRSVHYSGRTVEDFDSLAADIIYAMADNKADKQFRHVWGNHSMDSVYTKQLSPILYEETRDNRHNTGDVQPKKLSGKNRKRDL